MKTYLLAIIFLIFMFLGTASADDRLYLYKPCSGEQNCIELAYDNGEKESVQANPSMVLAKSDITAFIRSGGFPGITFLDIELDKEVSKKINQFFGENFGKGIIIVFNNKIININPPAIIKKYGDRTTYSFGNWRHLLKQIPWLKDLIEESYNSVIGRNVWIYVITSLGIILAAFIFVFFPRNKLVSNQVS
jgi:hypothetical protein